MKKNDKRIYLDNTFSTKIDNKVKKKMIENFNFFANNSMMYEESRNNRNIINTQYQEISKILNSNENENFFINSEIEFYNLILTGILEKYKNCGKHIITTKIESYKILKLFKSLEKKGFEITYLDVNENGIIDINNFKKKLRTDTILTAISYTNEEIGSIQPIKEISKIIKDLKDNNKNSLLPIFYSDFSNAVNFLDINVQNLNIDLASMFSHRFYGPKNIGIYYKKEDIEIDNNIITSKQEFYSLSNNKPIFLTSGFTEALKMATRIKNEEFEKMTILKKYFIKKLKDNIKNISIIGGEENKIPNHINLSLEGIEGEAIVLMLDNEKISVSTGSACSAIDLDGSHVLEAMNIPILKAHGSIRISFEKNTTKNDLDYVIEKIIKITERLRSFSAVKIK